MFNTTNNNPIKIGILEASSQNKAILEFFFSNSGKSVFKQTSVDKAEVFIIDYDFPGARESWENISKETGQPGIILSIKEVELPSAIWIAKPLTMSALIEAASGIREFIKNDVKAPVAESFVVEPEKTEVIAKEEPLETKVVIAEETQAESKAVITEAKQVEKVKTKQAEQHAELAIAGSDDSFSYEEAEQTKPKKISEPAIDAMLELDTLDAVEFEKEAVVDAQEIEMLSLEAEESTVEAKQEEIIADLDLMMPIVETSSEEENSEEPAIDAMLELDTLNGIDIQEDEQQDEVSSEISVDEIKPNEEETGKKEVVTNTKEMSSATDYAVSQVMIDVNLDETSKPVEEEIEKEVEVENITPEEEEIDSLIESLISGGKSKENKVKEVSPETDNSLSLETTEETKPDSVLTPEVDIIDVDLELETIDTDQKIELSTDATSAEVRGIEDDATAIIVEEFTQSGESALQEEGVNTDSIGEEIYIDPEKPEAAKEKPKKETAEEELQKLLNELKQEAEDAVDSIPSHRISSEPGMHVLTKAEDRWNLTCGDNDEVKNPKDLDKSSFVLSNQMLSSFFDALEQSKYTKKVMRLKFKGHIIVIDYASDFIYCDNSIYSDSYAAVCFNPIKEDKIKVHKLDKSEIRLYNTKRVENPENSHTIESFVWTTSLLTAKGRLLKYTDMNKKVGLKYWPNLTRLEQIPHAMQIAAVFYKHPGSLMEVTKWLDIEQRYIFAFYNAALSLKLIELDSNKIVNSAGDLDTGPKKNRGFFARLLKRIKS